MNSTFRFVILSSLTTALPMSVNDRNSARSPSISSLIPRISSNNAPASTPNPDSDSDSDFSFSFPFPFAATFLFFDGPASDPSFPAPTSHVFLLRLQCRQAVARGESLQKHFSPDFMHPSHTCPSFTNHVTPFSTKTDPTNTSNTSLPRFFPLSADSAFFAASAFFSASAFLARRTSFASASFRADSSSSLCFFAASSAASSAAFLAAAASSFLAAAASSCLFCSSASSSSTISLCIFSRRARFVAAISAAVDMATRVVGLVWGLDGRLDCRVEQVSEAQEEGNQLARQKTKHFRTPTGYAHLGLRASGFGPKRGILLHPVNTD